MQATQMSWWIGFNLFVLAMLALDLGVFHRKSHTVKIKEALLWSGAWIGLALLFNAWIYFARGTEPAVQFLTGYLIEKSLSVDNLFVIALIFTFFQVPEKYQHKVLFWGILGALLMRAGFIWAGVALIHKFEWMIYVFGAFLVFTGIRMLFQKDKKLKPEKNPLLKIFRRVTPVTESFEGSKFFVERDGKRFATPLFIALLFVEMTDLLFAVDSIPAIIAVTKDPFIVYTSNVFAILGLRSLYFALSGIMALFHHLHYGLSAILVFVGTKMALVDIYKIPTHWSLFVIAAILGVSIAASLRWPKKEGHLPVQSPPQAA
jgi:tellurite resistance protein TerC